ncbi:sensor histidine kinase [Microbacterium tumbae]
MAKDAAGGPEDARIVSAVGAPPSEGADADGRSRGSGSAWEKYGWVMAAIWMVFLAYPLLGLLRSTAETGWIVAGWIALATFVVVYIAGFVNGMSGRGGGLVTRPKPIQWCAFAVLIVCAVSTVPAVGGNALSFVPFIMSFASYGLTRLAHWLTLAFGIAITAAAVLLVPEWISYISVLAIVVLLAVVNTVSTSLIIRSAEAERLGLELATSEGREAVARDVHDLIGHSLTVVRMKAQLAHRLIDADPERAKAELADIEALTAEAISGVRETVAGVRSAALAEQLASCRDVLADAGVALRVEGEVEALSPAQSLTAGWILREATTNVLRHASARTVVARVSPGRLSIADDGIGFAGQEGNGLRGMRERAAMSGATLAVTAGESGGTIVEVTW